MRGRVIRAHRLALACLLAPALLAACGASPGASPSTSAPATASSPAGPASFADWTARQGFGGASGLGLISEDIQRLRNRPTDITAFIAGQDVGNVDALAGWLDGHPATTCWADYHATVRAGLADLAAGYAKVRAAIDGGTAIPDDVTAAMAERLAQLQALKAPASCP